MHDIKGRDFISLRDYTSEDLHMIWNTSDDLKRKLKRGEPCELLKGKTLLMIFEGISTRTRISFETAMTQLGGHAQYISSETTHMGKPEISSDTARVMSRYGDGIIARVWSQSALEELARYADIPVISGCTDYGHPCQAAADFQTIIEKKKKLEGLRYAFVWGFRQLVGPPIALVNSTIYAAAKTGVELIIGCPEGYEPDKPVLEKAYEDAAMAGAKINIVHDMKEAVTDADIVNVKSWVNPEDLRRILESGKKYKAPHMKEPEKYRKWIVTPEILDLAKKDVNLMHCMPVARNEEVTDEAIDGPKSIIIDEAENRLHVQKAILSLLMGGI